MRQKGCRGGGGGGGGERGDRTAPADALDGLLLIEAIARSSLTPAEIMSHRMTQPTTNSIQRAWLRRRRGRVVVGGGVVMCGVVGGGFARVGHGRERARGPPRALLAGSRAGIQRTMTLSLSYQFNILYIPNKYARA